MKPEPGPLTDEELSFLDKLDDVLPTSRAYVRRALAEIRARRSATRALSETHERLTHERDAYRAILAELLAARTSPGRPDDDLWHDARDLLKNGARNGSARALTDEERVALRSLAAEVRDSPDWVRPSARRRRDVALAVIDYLTGGPT